MGDHNREVERRKPTLDRDTKEIFSSMFFGWQLDETVQEQEQKATATAVVSQSEREKAADSQQSAIAAQVDRFIPKDAAELKKADWYKETYKMIQWQRDNYLVGTEYANWRKKERLRQSDRLRDIRSFQHEIVFDETALGHQQVGRLASQYVPSDTLRNALLPLVVGLPAGVLYQPTKHALINLISGQQENLDGILKSQISQFLSNPDNRLAIKSTTQGYISTAYQDSES